jgi:hypothetical protein
MIRPTPHIDTSRPPEIDTTLAKKQAPKANANVSFLVNIAIFIGGISIAAIGGKLYKAGSSDPEGWIRSFKKWSGGITFAIGAGAILYSVINYVTEVFNDAKEAMSPPPRSTTPTTPRPPLEK